MDPFGVFPRSVSDLEDIESQIQNIGEGLELTWVFQITKDSRRRLAFYDGLKPEEPEYESPYFKSISSLACGVKERIENFDRSVLYGATAKPFFFNVREDYYMTPKTKQHDKKILWNKIKNSSKFLIASPKLAVNQILESASKLYDIYTDVHFTGLSDEEIAEFERLYNAQS